MESLPPSHRGYRFGPFELDVRTGELRKRGLKIALQQQPFRVLEALLERPDEVVTREALRSRLWADGTFVDFEHSLNAAIRRLRTALGDTGDAPRFVETLHRRGYRLFGPVEPIGALSSIQAQRPDMPRRPEPPRASDLGRTLGADYLIEGTVRREGAQLRITVQLIDTHQGTHVWAATFDTRVANALALETEVANQIAEGVRVARQAG